MPREIKAFQFWVRPTAGTTAALRAAIAGITPAQRAFQFTQHGKNFLTMGLAWHAHTGILTGTVYLLRSNDLPAAVTAGRVAPLPITAQTDLGEPMCFAFHPDVGAALVHYAHTGPRHSVLAAVIEEFVPDIPIGVEPVIRQDMLQRLQQKHFFRGIEFTLSNPNGVQELQAAGGSINHAIEMLDGLNGVNIKVEITMGHTRGQGMTVNATKALARRLMQIGTQHIDESDGVKMIKVRGSDGVDAPVEELDLLNAREKIDLEVDESHRSIDTGDACQKLRTELSGRLDDLRNQAGNA